MQEDTFDIFYYGLSLFIIIGIGYRISKLFYSLLLAKKYLYIAGATLALIIIYLFFNYLFLSLGNYLEVYFHKIYVLAVSLYFTKKLVLWLKPVNEEKISGTPTGTTLNPNDTEFIDTEERMDDNG